MAIVRGLCLVRTLPSLGAINCPAFIRPVSSSVCRKSEEGYVVRNKNLGRPLSPSLKLLFTNPEPVWILSIGHRATGFILTPAISIMSIAYIASRTPFPEFIKAMQPLYETPALWGAVKFMMAFPFTYHCFNGLRHLYWDTGKGYTMQFTVRAGFTVLGLAILSSLGLAMYSPS